MKRRFFAILILAFLIPAASLSAYDQIWGARLDMNMELPEFYGSTIALTTENAAKIWYRGSWGPLANIELDGGLGFDYDFMFGLTNEIEFSWHGFGYSHYPELDKLAYYGRTGNFGYKAGRQIIEDPAALIVSAPFDGADFNVDIGRHILKAGFGYTGLTFRQSSQYFITATDLSDDVLSTGRMIEYASWELPAATEWLNASAYFLASQDLSGEEDALNPLYLEMMIRGFIGSSFLYNLSMVGQYGSFDGGSVLAGIGRLSFSWLPGNSSRLGVDLLVSSGDSWADRNQYLLDTPPGTKLNQYNPLSIVSTQGYVIEFEVGNLTSLGIFYAKKPRDTYSWELRTTTFLRTSEGPVSSTLVPSTSADGHFLGQEALLSWFWRPRSDFGWDLKLGLLYAGNPIQLDTLLQENYLDTVPVLFRLGFDWSWSF